MTHSNRRLVTQNQLIDDLKHIGLGDGDSVMVHSSLSKIGYVIGGAQTVIKALLGVVGKSGTLIMPAFSQNISDPANWDGQNFTDNEIQILRENLPVFDKELTPTGMGAIPEAFRAWPGVIRSDHPQVSVCAIGPDANFITDTHPLEFGEGANSPFARLYERDAKILLLGVWSNRATALHYAESLVPHGRRKERCFPIEEDGVRKWVQVPDIGDDLNTHFPPIGDIYFAREGDAKVANIGDAKSCLVSTKGLVDFGRDYLSKALA